MSADFWAGYLSGAAGILIGNPLDLVKVRLQAGSSAGVPRQTAAAPAARRVAALATGAAAPVLGYGALNALLFVSYRQAEAVLRPAAGAGAGAGTPDRLSPAGTAWVAGAVAGLATWIVSAPTELVKCRTQLAGQGASAIQATTTSSSWSVARAVWRAEGLRGFFLGGTVTALRDSIGYGFYFWSYLLASDAWKTRLGNPGGDTAASLVCGGLAGIVTWASVFPLDVVKTRVQAQALLPASTASTAASTASTSPRTPLLAAGQPAAAAAAPTRLSTLAVARQTYRAGGLGVFFRGLGVCSARAFVVNAAQWAVYEWIMRELGAPTRRE